MSRKTDVSSPSSCPQENAGRCMARCFIWATSSVLSSIRKTLTRLAVAAKTLKARPQSAARSPRSPHLRVEPIERQPVAEGEDVEIDGRVVAQFVSTRERGPMYGTVLYMGDVVSPVVDPEDFDAISGRGEDP